MSNGQSSHITWNYLHCVILCVVGLCVIVVYACAHVLGLCVVLCVCCRFMCHIVCVVGSCVTVCVL